MKRRVAWLPSFFSSVSDALYRGTLPVAVPDKIFGLTPFLDFIDRGHSLNSLNLPPAALGSLLLSSPIPSIKKWATPKG